MLDGKVVGADNEAELELFKNINFTNALVLKINQLAKQVCLSYKWQHISPMSTMDLRFFP